MTCDTCGRMYPTADVHPCRFERGCSCWYGTPCILSVLDMLDAGIIVPPAIAQAIEHGHPDWSHAVAYGPCTP